MSDFFLSSDGSPVWILMLGGLVLLAVLLCTVIAVIAEIRVKQKKK